MIHFGTLRSIGQISKPIKFRKMPYKSPVDVFLRICGCYENAFLLESLGGDAHEESARFSFIGFDPDIIINVKNGVANINGDRFEVCDPLEPIKALLKMGFSSKNTFKYIGGAVGYISYDAIRYWERLPGAPINDLGFPDVEMGVYRDGIVFDHECREAFYFYREKADMGRSWRRLKSQ